MTGRPMHELLGGGALALALLLIPPAAARAAADLDETTTSPDITIAVDSGTLTVADEDALIEAGGPPALSGLGAIPGAADLSGYHLLDNGDQLFSLDITVELPGPVTAGPRDVVSYDGAGYAIVFDGATEGVPDGARIDAITAAEDGDLILSFDVTVDLGGGLIADDEDLVRFDSGTGFSSFLDADAAPAFAPGSLDLDGAHYLLATQHLLVSFDGSGSVGGVDFDDEDVLELDPGTGTWELSVDSGLLEPDWAAADLDALHAVRSCALLGGDNDADLLCDDEDPCPTYANTLPIVDANGDGIPNECQCGDTDGNGFLTSTDSFNAVVCGNNPACAQGPIVLALWDTDRNGFLTSTDSFNDVVRGNAGTEYLNICDRRPGFCTLAPFSPCLDTPDCMNNIPAEGQCLGVPAP